jgi:hypothetical protein
MGKIIIITGKIGATQYSGYAIDFIANYIVTNKGFRKDEVSEHWIRITLTQFAILGWGFGGISDNNLLIKVAFPFAIEMISEKVKDGTLKEFEEKIISRGTDTMPYPYDLDKISVIEGYEIAFPEEDIDIGRRIETNKLADSIIELRDNINALIYSKKNEILLKLGQERNILYLFRRIDNREQFTFAISTLGNLVNDINTDLLKILIKDVPPDKKPFQLLELFLSRVDFEPFNTVNIFRTINRIRQGFPIHTDKTDIILALKKFGIEYPIQDYNKAWQLISENYRLALEGLLDKIKNYSKSK